MDSLNTYLIPAPLSALLTFVSGISIAVVSDYTGKKIFRSEDPVLHSMYFFAGLLVLSWTIWIIGLLGLATVLVFQILLWIIIGSAVCLVLSKRLVPFYDFSRNSNFLKKDFKSVKFYISSLLLVMLIGYAILCLTVPTDSDSLSYHLALPVEILQKGSLWFNKDNLHFRMAGFGEMLNLLGVANGCPQLGAFIQIIALLYVLQAFLATSKPEQQLNLLILFLGIPALLFLLPNQKHQLTGILCTTICFLFLLKKLPITNRTLTLFICVMLFAAGIKYSFVLSCAALILLFLLKNPAGITLSSFFIKLFILSGVILGPQLLFRWYYFGDPLSPLLEGFLANPDPVILKLHTYIKNYKESAFTFPIGLLVTNSPGQISTILGVGALILGFLPFLFRFYKAEVTAIIFLMAAILVGGQVSSRFFMEPLLWTIPLFVSIHSSSPYFRYFLLIPKLQILIIVPFILFGLYNISPSIFSDKLRHEVMMRSANGYAESLWLDEILPVNARIVTSSRSRAFLPRPYLSWEYLVFTSQKDEKQISAFREKLAEYKITYMVLPYHGAKELKKLYAGELIYGPKKFPLAVRNPFNRHEYELAVYKIK